ncbi:MAG: hypothetical protein KF852_20905 [Saprospiraceae bacterium]|nr:hypothetical protein [Saprospiraceae bacterium]
MMRHFLCTLVLCSPLLLTAQEVVSINIPDVEIIADRLIHGDADTYGLGDWSCSFRLSRTNDTLVLKGEIIFSERANDHTIIAGYYRQYIPAPELQKYAGCSVVLSAEKGKVSGPNIGARGYRWFKGSDLINKAYIRTDTFGMDVGKIGGTVKFNEVSLTIYCHYSAAHSD